MCLIRGKREPFPQRNVTPAMIVLLSAAMMASPATTADAALAMCRPAIERRAGGRISTIAVDKSKIGTSATTIGGPLTIFVGIGPPIAGSASAHHLIRADYRYQCMVRGKRVREVILSQ
jgi:hypothetical protein